MKAFSVSLKQASDETKILDIGWNKQNDTLSVARPTFKNNNQLTRWIILSELTSVHDPTDLISAPNLIEKKLNLIEKNGK